MAQIKEKLEESKISDVEAFGLIKKIIELQKEINALTEKKDEMKEKLRRHMEASLETRLVNENVGIAMFVDATTKTLKADLVEKALGVKLTDECYKHGSYTSFKVVPIVQDTTPVVLSADPII